MLPLIYEISSAFYDKMKKVKARIFDQDKVIALKPMAKNPDDTVINDVSANFEKPPEQFLTQAQKKQLNTLKEKYPHLYSNRILLK